MGKKPRDWWNHKESLYYSWFLLHSLTPCNNGQMCNSISYETHRRIYRIRHIKHESKINLKKIEKDIITPKQPSLPAVIQKFKFLSTNPATKTLKTSWKKTPTSIVAALHGDGPAQCIAIRAMGMISNEKMFWQIRSCLRTICM